MDTKKLLVSFLAIATVLTLVATVSAGEVTTGPVYVYIDGELVGADPVAVLAGDTISVKVVFTSDVGPSTPGPEDADDKVQVKISAEINRDVEATTEYFDVEQGVEYRKTLKLKVPYYDDLKDEVSEDGLLKIEIYSKDDETELNDIDLRIQRQAYKVDVMSISTLQTADAGQLLPVDVVLKNKGYNELDDLYVVVKIPALGAERTGYFGDLYPLDICDDDDDCDEEDTVSGRIYLQIPDDAKEGLYTVEVEVSDEDTSTTATKQIAIENEFYGNNVIAPVTGKTAAVGQDAEYSILIVNPTDKVRVYNVVPEASSGVAVSASESVVAVPAGSSKTVTITANAAQEGAYTFGVNVISGEEVVSTSAFSLNVEGRTVASPVVVLTIILAIIFIVLLIVLIVLLGKKPEKSEEFGESYY